MSFRMNFRRKRFEQYTDLIGRLYPELASDGTGKDRVLSRTVTFQVTDNCNLACKYCYQINKGKRKMSLEVAKKYVDLLLSGDKGFHEYVNPEISPGLVIEFIGGEPFMEIELIDEICDYFFKEAIRLNHPWAEKHCFSICSNGVLYTDPRVQKFLQKHHDNISFSVTIDGNKELHDSCRVFHDGSPSYDIASAAAKDWMARGYYMGSKITIAPENITYLYDAIVHIIEELKYDEINCNCVYEEGWKAEHATELYYQLKRIADYLIEKNLEKDIYISIFEEAFFKPKPVDDVNNWCFKAGTLIQTVSGPIPIENIEVGTLVNTMYDEVHAVQKISKHRADDGMLIKANSMLDTYTTSDHPYLVYSESPTDKKQMDARTLFIVGRFIKSGYRNDTQYVITCGPTEVWLIKNILDEKNVDYEFHELNEMKQTEFIFSHIDPIFGELFASTFQDDVRHLPADACEYDRNAIVSLLEGLSDIKDEYIVIPCHTEVLKYDICNLLYAIGLIPSVEEIPDGYSITFPFNISYIPNTKFIPARDLKVGDEIALSVPKFNTEHFDPTLAFMVGRYLRNGVYGNDQYCIICDASENFNEVLDSCNVLYETQVENNTTYYLINNEDIQLKPILSRLGTVNGHYETNGYLYNCDREVIESLVNGMSTNDVITLRADDELFETTLTFVRMLGKYPVITDYIKRVEGDVIEISIRDTAENMRFSEDGSILWTKVTEVSKVDEPYYVYNLTVKVNHTFIANGAIVHNCGGTGMMLSCDPDGYLYPCIRYMESSLGCDRPPYRIGSVETGIAQTPDDQQRVDCLNCINRRTESTDECFYCPIAEGCSWCSAYNYQINGTPDSRVTYICEMHKARALANAYLWAKCYEKHDMHDKFKIFVPEEWALQIIPKEEWEMLINLPNAELVTDPEIIKDHQKPMHTPQP